MSNEQKPAYAVGYGKPPVEGRFQKGRSGNPKGRPRKKSGDPQNLPTDSALDDILRAELYRELTINEPTGPRQMSMRQIVARAQATAAAKGNVYAQRDILRQARDLEVRDAERKARKEAEDRQVFDYVVARKATQVAKWAEAELAGIEPIDPWPHPDDMFVNHTKQHWRLRGPWDEDGLPLYEFYRAQRDALFAQMILDWRQRNARKLGGPSRWDIWLCFDLLLPKRWQILDVFEMTAQPFLSLPLSDLRARQKQLWDRAEALRVLTPLRPLEKDDRRLVDRWMRPVLKPYGYRSLAEFEKAYEIHGIAMPWPKRSAPDT